MKNEVYLSIGFDPRDLWFQAGFSFAQTGVTQWSQDFDSAARALERFLSNDFDVSGGIKDVRAYLSGETKVVLALDQKSQSSLEAAAKSENQTLEEWLLHRLRVAQVDLSLPKNS